MKLSDWLEREKRRPSEFARAVKVTPATIFGLCNGTVWLGKDLAMRILDETGGEVTPTDFLLTQRESAS